MCFGHPNSRSLGEFCSNLVWFGSMKNAVLELPVLHQEVCGHAKIQPDRNTFGFLQMSSEYKEKLILQWQWHCSFPVCWIVAAICLEVAEVSRCSILPDLSNLLRLGLSEKLEPDAACPACCCWLMR